MIELLIIIVITVLPIVYVYVKRQFSYWKKYGIQFYEPEFPFGNCRTMNRTESIAEVTKRYYETTKHKAPLVGIYTFLKPGAIITDLDLIKNVLIKDFNHFVSRGFYHNEKDDPLSAHLFSVDSEKWKKLRAKITPTFTSGKIKYMFPTVVSVSNNLIAHIHKTISNSNSFEIKDIAGRFTTDVIGTCGFGIECNSFSDPTNKFALMGRRIIEDPRNVGFWDAFMTFYPSLARKFGIKYHHDDITKFFANVVTETVEYRETNNIQRNDFMNLMIQLKNKGKLGGDTSDQKVTFTLQEVQAQAFVFFLAGYDASSTTISFTLFELSLNTEIQDKAREEAFRYLKKCNGEFTYESTGELKYLEKVINETLRKYPPVAAITRSCIKDYVEPRTSAIIKEGMLIFIPILGIHYDPEIYPHPEVYDPERFEPDAIQQRHSLSHLPFGEGPRSCIGLRFAMTMAKVGLAKLLTNFRFTKSSKTKIPLEFDPKTFALVPKGGLWVNIDKL